MNTPQRHLGNNMATKIEKLKTNIWITKGARFNAYRRLSRKNHASIFAISILSFYNVGIALFPDMIGDKIASPASIAVSIFILIISLLEAGKGYAVKAERMHQNAIDLGHLLGKIDRKEKISDAVSERFYEDYYKLIKNCPENHSPCDDKLFRTEHPHDFKLEYEIEFRAPFIRPFKIKTFKIKKLICHAIPFLYHFETYWLYLALIVSPVLFIILFDAG